jgi:hypothetical protein
VYTRRPLTLCACAFALSAIVPAQGPASCGYHLDIRANGTSTHSAVGDLVPGGPGAVVGMPTGFPGSPFNAYATPGTTIVMTISGNPLAFGPFPLGPGSCATIFYNVAAPQVPLPLGPPFVGTCGGGPHIIGILGGVIPGPVAIIDSCGFVGPPPPVGLFDVPFSPTPGRMTFTAAIPPFAPSPINLQVGMMTPAGGIALTNAVSLILGPNPAEVPVPAPAVCGGFIALDEGQSVGIPTPPGFTFYGFPTPAVDMDTNGFVDFVPGVGAAIAGGCDFAGAFGDLGCPVPTAQARPRIEVNHADYNFAVVPAVPWVPAMTMEFRPPGPTWQDAVILRWKNAPAFGAAAGIAGLATASLSLELHGAACACTPPDRIVITREWLVVVDQAGVGPGIAAQGYGGPPPAVAPSTCALGAPGLAFMGTFAPPIGLPYVGGVTGTIHMDAAAPSAAVLNSAIVLTPMLAGVPDGYILVTL